MKNIYTFGGQPARRSLTIADMREAKGVRKLVQVTANNTEEARAVEQAGIDMMVCDAASAQVVREANRTTFCTAAIKMTEHATTDDILREAFRVLHLGVDAIITPRSFRTVETLAREGVPVMGHLGLVPRKSIWIGGLRAVGKTGDEAAQLLDDLGRLEDAGAFAVEIEVVPGQVLEAMSGRTRLITVSLGSGPGGDVMFLFMRDLCGETDQAPRHARAFGDLASLHEALFDARVGALRAFREASLTGAFPSTHETPSIEPAELDRFGQLTENLERNTSR